MTDVTVGVGPASIKVSVPPLARLRALFSRKVPSQYLAVLLRNSSLTITHPNEGHLDVDLAVVNLSSKPVTPHNLIIHYWRWLSFQMPDLPWTARGLMAPIAKRSIASLSISTQLNPAAIRRIAEGSPPEAWRLLGGGLALQLAGSLYVQESKSGARFELQDQRPLISCYWLKPEASDEEHAV